MKTVIKAARTVLCDRIVADCYVAVENGIITDISETEISGEEFIDLGKRTLMPGFIDTHVHGGDGVDTMDNSYDVLNKLSVFKIKQGVTAFMPTTVTAPMDSIIESVVFVKEAMKSGVDGAKILGSFVEGPYITPKLKGAHPEEYIRDVNIDELRTLLEAAEGTMRSIIIAPEKQNAEECIRFLAENGVIPKLGHTAATYEQFVKGIKAGGKIAVHTYNAMSGLAHREAGAVGGVMNSDNIYAELICDFVHVSPPAAEILTKVKGYEKMILVTDCMRAGGFPDGKYMLGVLEAEVKDGVARLSDGTIAGSTLALNVAVRNYHKTIGVPLVDAVNAASLNPAKAHGLDQNIGSISVGKSADIIGTDDNVDISFVMVNGVQKM